MSRTKVVVACMCVAGCAASDADRVPHSVSRLDSVGIELVLNGVSTDLLPLRSVVSAPVFELQTGQLDNGVLYEIVSIVPLADGRMAVGAAGSNAVVVLDAELRVLEHFGRTGDGPGEFERIGNLIPFAGDSIGVYDPFRLRLTVFDEVRSVGRILDLSTYTAPDSWSSVVGFGDELLFRDLGSAGWPPPPGIFQGSGLSHRLDREGRALSTYGPFPSWEMFFEGGIVATLPFGATGLVIPSVDLLVEGHTSEPELRYVGLDGELVRIVRWHSPAQLVTEAQFDAYKEALVQSTAEADRPGIRRQLSVMPSAQEMPVFSDLLATADGAIWVGDYIGPDALMSGVLGAERIWTVIAADGRLIERIETPAGFRPYLVRGDELVGVRVDDLGVETVQIYRLDGP